MGIVNVTDDSFHSASRTASTDAAVARGMRLVEEGADLLDIGAESTRPGAMPVAQRDELRRLLPVIERLAATAGVPISVDTYKAAVAQAACAAGAGIVNDVSGGLLDRQMPPTVAALGVPVVVGHLRGDPQTMATLAEYGPDPVAEIRAELAQRVESFLAAGVAPDAVWIDPGIGFAKTTRENVAVLARLGEFTALGYRVVVGASRKRFLGELLARRGLEAEIEHRLEASLAVAVMAAAAGAALVRVHDVEATVRALAIADAIVHQNQAVSDRGERG